MLKVSFGEDRKRTIFAEFLLIRQIVFCRRDDRENYGNAPKDYCNSMTSTIGGLKCRERERERAMVWRNNYWPVWKFREGGDEYSRQLSHKKCHFDTSKIYFIILQFTIYHIFYSSILYIKIIYFNIKITLKKPTIYKNTK